MATKKPNNLLRKWLAEQGTSIYELMRALGCSYPHAWLIVRGKRDVTPETLGKLLIAFGADGPAPQMAEHMRHLLTAGHVTVAAPRTNGKGK